MNSLQATTPPNRMLDFYVLTLALSRVGGIVIRIVLVLVLACSRQLLITNMNECKIVISLVCQTSSLMENKQKKKRIIC